MSAVAAPIRYSTALDHPCPGGATFVLPKCAGPFRTRQCQYLIAPLRPRHGKRRKFSLHLRLASVRLRAGAASCSGLIGFGDGHSLRACHPRSGGSTVTHGRCRSGELSEERA